MTASLQKVLDECFKNGLIVERRPWEYCGQGDAELLIEEETLKKGLDILKNSISM